nr:class I SAM-dependent DNA methyltransferase [Thiorhodovibrio winogradskyi]
MSWNEIRTRAATFARDWAGQGYEKGQTQLFYRDLFDVFGVPVRRVASFEAPVRKLGDRRGYIDSFWKGVLLVEQKSLGRDLAIAKEQAFTYFPGLKDVELPRYLLLSDFQSFELYDLEEDEQARFSLAELPEHVEKLGFIVGVQKRSFKDQDPVNIAASELVGRLHDGLKASGYTGHDLELFLVRLVFCLFADDTGIFEPRDIFLDLIEQRTDADGTTLGASLNSLFQILNTPPEQRSPHLDEDLARFPFVNGALFREPLLIPFFDAGMRQRLLDACAFDWSRISPAIFGSLFQSVMDRDERRRQGAHYTTEQNILKVIEPLFLDGLRAELAALKARRDTHRRKRLQDFQRKLASLTFFDPACGCGNFLIIAYRELRLLEIEVIRELRAYSVASGQQELDAAELSMLNVDQFYGIEIIEFPARIAETALWMMDHIMNTRLSLEFGQSYVRIPLRTAPHILNADALEMDWAELLPPARCHYLLGNPPFVGAKYQSEKQRAQVRGIANLGASGGTLDYVTAWFITAAAYLSGVPAHNRPRIGFVATNSITQGEQVAQLWPRLFEQGVEIAFAHRTFAWGSDARGKAHVHVVIVGLAPAADLPEPRRLFDYSNPGGAPHETALKTLSPYLFEASQLVDPHLVVREQGQPINGLPKLIIGSKPIDGGHYILNAAEKAELLVAEPEAEPFLRPYIGSQEFLNGGERWILALHRAEPALIKRLPRVRERVAAVRAFRESSKSKPTKKLAETPLQYHVNVIPTSPFLVIPKVSSERRDYVPIGWLEPPVIPSDLVFVLSDANFTLFAFLTSAMHMSWLRRIGGRLESRYRYSIGMVYNTFPLPQAREDRLAKLEPLAQAVLDARAAHPDATLADLYDPNLMPTALRRAHQALDRAVDRLYLSGGFSSERERVEHLLARYEEMLHGG